ncbi:MAG: phosphoribosylglycinamide formyltransferase [Candidatus Krumholzibacteriia bacterium]
MTQERCNVAVLASGTGTNFQAIVEACRPDDRPARVVCLITDNAEAGALEIARRFDVASHVVDPCTNKARLPEAAEERIVSLCEEHSADLVALAGFMRILAGPLLSRFEGRIMNVHPSLLPSFKGLHGARQALEYGVKVAGCTVHFVDRSVDGGAIILQAPVGVDDDDDEESLLKKIHEMEHRIYVRAIELFAEGRLRVNDRRVVVTD